MPKGGPDGGNGGAGGDVLLSADENTDTLSDFVTRKHFEAHCGLFGRGKNCAGRNGEDLILKVPPGTVVYAKELPSESSGSSGSSESTFLGELLHHGDLLLVAHGGRGGFGNAHFKSNVRRIPDFAELGEPGERQTLKLELKLVADVGIIGYPNVGKSTLITAVSSARPKIAPYPFTTLVPNLGVVRVHGRSYVVCDIPGLIEGASEGKGLGDKFLRHIERCGILLHLLDVSRAFANQWISGDPDPALLAHDYKAIRKELESSSPTLSRKRERVILNKVDLIGNDARVLERALREEHGIEVFLSTSAISRHRTGELMEKLLPLILEERRTREIKPLVPEEVLPVLRPHLESDQMGAYRIEKRPDGSLLVSGKRVEQFTVMTNFANSSAVQRFRHVLDRIGLRKALLKLREGHDTPISIGRVRVEEYL